MSGKILSLTIAAVLISFIGGFLLANALNRNELNKLRAENERLSTVQNQAKQSESEAVLTDEEIKERIAEADRNPDNFGFQKNLGIALYRYGTMKQDAELLGSVERLLRRAFENNPKDSEVLTTLGNVHFDIGYYKKDNDEFIKARDFYQQVLKLKPNDTDVRADLGLTFFLTNPPENDRAIAEFEKSLQTNPKHEKSLQVMAQTLLKENKISEAEKFIARLKAVNPDNQTLPDLEAQVSQGGNLNIQKQ